jgi:hypothetical protein
MQRNILIVCLFLAPFLLLFYSVKDDFYEHSFTYLAIVLWISATILIFKKRKGMKNGPLILSHLIVAIIGIIGIIDNY